MNTKKDLLYIAEGKRFKASLAQFYKEQKLDVVLESCRFEGGAKVYIASGEMFSQFGRLGLEMLADIFDTIGLRYYLPQDAEFNNKETDDFVVTNRMITDGDNEELRTCDFVLAHLTDDMDAGVCGEISRFKTMSEYNPEKYTGVVGWLDDIRLATVPNSGQKGKDNQTMYYNQFTVGEIENSLGCYYTIGDAILKIYEVYKEESDE